MRIEREVEVAAPPERVFAVVTDLSTHVEWRPAVREFRAADGGPPRVGSEIVEVVRFGGRDVRMRYKVLELDAPRSFSAGYLEGPVRVSIQFACEPRGSGTLTRFVVVSERPRLARVLPFPFFGALMGRAMDDELRRLKELVEGRS